MPGLRHEDLQDRQVLGLPGTRSKRRRGLSRRRFALRGLDALGYTLSARGCSSMVERQLPKLKVAGSSPVSRSNTHLAAAFRGGRRASGVEPVTATGYYRTCVRMCPVPAPCREGRVVGMHARRTRSDGNGIAGVADRHALETLAVAWAVLACALALVLARPSTAHAGWPFVGPSKVTLGFGALYSTGEGDSSRHRGVDIEAAAGDRVVAPLSGRVSFAGSVPGVGGGRVGAVTIETSHGKVTLLPLEGTSVSRGTEVAEGDEIGTVARSGDGSGAGEHLHVGAREGDLYVDPMSILTPPPAGTVPDAQVGASVGAPGPVVIGATVAVPVGGAVGAPVGAGVPSGVSPAASAADVRLQSGSSVALTAGSGELAPEGPSRRPGFDAAGCTERARDRSEPRGAARRRWNWFGCAADCDPDGEWCESGRRRRRLYRPAGGPTCLACGPLAPRAGLHGAVPAHGGLRAARRDGRARSAVAAVERTGRKGSRKVLVSAVIEDVAAAPSR